MIRNVSNTTLRKWVTSQLPLARDKSDTLLLLLSCVLVLAPQAAHLPVWISTLIALLLVGRSLVTLRGLRMPPRWVLLPLAVLATVGVYRQFGTVFGRDAGVALVALLLAFKLLEMRARRDLFVVLYLSLFLLLTNFFYSQTMLTALLMMVAIIALLTTQITFQYTGLVPPLTRRLRTGASILALAAPLAIALFVLFPRIPGPLWSVPTDATSARSGLSGEMTPGSISNLALSDAIAFRVHFKQAPPPQASLYWRGPVLSHYDGRSWTESRYRWQSSATDTLAAHGSSVDYEVTLEPHSQRWVFALDIPARPPQLAENPVRLDYERQLIASAPISQRIRYNTSSYLFADWQADASNQELQTWLQLPVVGDANPRTRAFARRLQRKFSTDAERVHAVLRYFRQQPFRYTLHPPLLGADGVDEFLFTTRAGFCEHYAGAFVLLMREMDIPARVVTGYQGGEMNPVDGFLTVRQSDAHAWAEVWLDGHGWSRVDPTAAVAPERIERNLASTQPRPFIASLLNFDDGSNAWSAPWKRLRMNWDAVGNAWNQWVLNYTSEVQQNLLKSLGFENPDWHTLTGLLAVAGALFMLFLAAPYLSRRPRIDLADALYCALSQRMARHGLARLSYEGPHAYRQRLLNAAPALHANTRAALSDFLKLYETLRYGAPTDTEAGAQQAILSQLKFLLRQCR